MRTARVCSVLIPDKCLTPYTLSNHAIGIHWLESVIDRHQNAFESIPND